MVFTWSSRARGSMTPVATSSPRKKVRIAHGSMMRIFRPRGLPIPPATARPASPARRPDLITSSHSRLTVRLPWPLGRSGDRSIAALSRVSGPPRLHHRERPSSGIVRRLDAEPLDEFYQTNVLMAPQRGLSHHAQNQFPHRYQAGDFCRSRRCPRRRHGWQPELGQPPEQPYRTRHQGERNRAESRYSGRSRTAPYARPDARCPHCHARERHRHHS